MRVFYDCSKLHKLLMVHFRIALAGGRICLWPTQKYEYDQ